MIVDGYTFKNAIDCIDTINKYKARTETAEQTAEKSLSKSQGKALRERRRCDYLDKMILKLALAAGVGREPIKGNG